MRLGLLIITSIFAFLLTFNSVVFAAPIGVPGATRGPDHSRVGVELNFMVDRDLNGSGDTEGITVLAKGEVGVTQRIDFLYRVGFGRFESRGEDSDTGPAFGFGTKVTWGTIEDINLKIGSVFQMLQIRADVDGGGRQSFREYDFALGAFVDAVGSGSSGKRSILTTYGGFVFSGLEIDGGKLERSIHEDDSFGVFVGLLMDIKGKTELGVELRLVEQTALSINASFPF